MSEKGWDLTSQHSLQGAVDWIGKRSDALLVVVVRAGDNAIYVDDRMAPRDALERLDLEMPDLVQAVKKQRHAKTFAAQRKAQKG
jgi:hypothetical protein